MPIDDHLDAIKEALRRSRAVVVVAEPGAGKTTRVPPALLDHGRLLLLQPRRAAARAIASRIAAEHEWTVGREIGWHIRFDRRFSDATRLIVATEGILTARLQNDPLLSDIQTLVLDEFHERSIHTDLGLALARQAWLARSDLHIVVMSATLDANPIARFLGDCPVVSASGRLYPIQIDYAPDQSVAGAAIDLANADGGNVLCFVAGAADVSRTTAELSRRTSAEVLPLYGALDADAQDRALSPGQSQRIIVSTNIAETSVTVPGVTAVVDSGEHKIARYDHARGIDSLRLEWITQDAADQRAGRAGRIAPGRVRRLWPATQKLRAARDPEIHRVDVSGCVLDLIACGERPDTFEWFEAPRADALAAALALLRRMGAVDGYQLTAVGNDMRRLPLPPRLARVLIAGDRSWAIARAVALLADGAPIRPRKGTASSDLLGAIDDWSSAYRHLDAAVRQLQPRDAGKSRSAVVDEAAFGRAMLAGFPDRVAQRRDRESPRFKLATGAGAILSRDSVVHTAAYIVALEVVAPVNPREPDAVIRAANAVDERWLSPTRTAVNTTIDPDGVARTMRVEYYDEIVLREVPATLDREVAERLLADAWLTRAKSGDDVRLLRRLAFAGIQVDERELATRAAIDRRSLTDITLTDALPAQTLRHLERDAPQALTVPSGRSVPLEYGDDGTVMASVKLQELFGLSTTPRLGPNRVPVTISLLAPNGRPVQLTRDLESFWNRTYPEVRKELRGRYPKHPWPEDPWTAPPTARTKKRM